MPKFITLTLFNSTETVDINADTIVSINHKTTDTGKGILQEMPLSFVEITDSLGKKYEVSTPHEEIVRMINEK